MTAKLCCIVEGHGEVESVPALIHKICHERSRTSPLITRPIRWNRQALMKAGEAERAVQLALKYCGQPGGVLILVDADDDCAAQLGPSVLTRARHAAGTVPVAVSFACREFEAWFVAAAECFRGFHGLPPDLTPPENPEQIRGAKEWLRKSTTSAISYRPGVDQLLFTKRLNLELARRAHSFRRFERETLVLLDRIEAISPPLPPAP